MKITSYIWIRQAKTRTNCTSLHMYTRHDQYSAMKWTYQISFNDPHCPALINVHTKENDLLTLLNS